MASRVELYEKQLQAATDAHSRQTEEIRSLRKELEQVESLQQQYERQRAQLEREHVVLSDDQIQEYQQTYVTFLSCRAAYHLKQGRSKKAHCDSATRPGAASTQPGCRP